jgi:hypothetical protein
VLVAAGQHAVAAGNDVEQASVHRLPARSNTKSGMKVFSTEISETVPHYLATALLNEY